MQLARLNERLAERGLTLELTDGARELITEAGWDPAYGARPLKRAIQRLLENPLALGCSRASSREGDTIRAYAELGEIRFARDEDAARQARSASRSRSAPSPEGLRARPRIRARTSPVVPGCGRAGGPGPKERR